MSEKKIVETKYYNIKVTKDEYGDYEINCSCAGRDLLALTTFLGDIFNNIDNIKELDHD